MLPRLMRFCQRGVVQFILIQTVVAAASIILLVTGHYDNPTWIGIQTIVYNVSYAWALYCLYVFYLAGKQTIKDFRPIAKFATVKLIVFATYYQSLFLKLALSDREHAVMWNDFLLCVEMVVFAVALMFAFPVTDFQGGIADRRVLNNVKDVFTVNDILHDLYHNFTPAYGDYALQRSQGEMPGTAARVLSMRTGSATGSSAPAGTAVTPLHALATGGSHSNPRDTASSTPSSPGSFTHHPPPPHLHPLSSNLNPVAREMAQRYRGKSRRMSFNRLLRGTQPVRATLRYRPDDIRGCVTEGDIEIGQVEHCSCAPCAGTQTQGIQGCGCLRRAEDGAHLSEYTDALTTEEEFKEHHLQDETAPAAKAAQVLEGAQKPDSAAEAMRIGRLSLAVKPSRKSPPSGYSQFPVNIVTTARADGTVVNDHTEPSTGNASDSNMSVADSQGTGRLERAAGVGCGGSPYPLVTMNDLHRVESCEWGEYA
jgi:hypothetical protein